MTIKMISRGGHRYGTRMMTAGELIYAGETQRKLLRALRWADDAPAEPSVTAEPPAAPPAQPPAPTLDQERAEEAPRPDAPAGDDGNAGEDDDDGGSDEAVKTAAPASGGDDAEQAPPAAKKTLRSRRSTSAR